MFSLISFRADGNQIEVANEKPAFYALTWHGVIVSYHHNLIALRAAQTQWERSQAEYQAEQTAKVDTVSDFSIEFVYKQAA